MKALTFEQRDFLLETFFKSEKFAGWRNIANKLLDTGSCIVPGDNRIWIGGIGNFIKISEAKGAVGCDLYEFDLYQFLSSVWFNEIRECHERDIAQQIAALTKKQSEIYGLEIW